MGWRCFFVAVEKLQNARISLNCMLLFMVKVSGLDWADLEKLVDRQHSLFVIDLFNISYSIYFSQCQLTIKYKRTKSGNHQLVIKLPIGDFEFFIGVFRIGDWGIRIEDWEKINMGKTPIPN